MRALVVFSILCLPAVAWASVGGETTTTSLILQAVTLAVNAYIAAEISPIKKRVKALEDGEILQ